MKNCRNCGRPINDSSETDTAGIIGMQLGFDYIMLLLGGFTAARLYSRQFITAFITAILFGEFYTICYRQKKQTYAKHVSKKLKKGQIKGQGLNRRIS
jgi:hypothetical protein